MKYNYTMSASEDKEPIEYNGIFADSLDNCKRIPRYNKDLSINPESNRPPTSEDEEILRILDGILDGTLEDKEPQQSPLIENIAVAVELDKLLQVSKQPQDTEEPVAPPSAISQDQLIDLSGLSADDLREKHKDILECNNFKYTEEDGRQIRAIAIEFTKRGAAPALREYWKPTGIDCNKDEVLSRYSNDLQVFDLYWIWSKHRGHEVNTTALGGLLTGIFSSKEFNFKQAYKIAVGAVSVGSQKKGREANLTSKNKINYLRLPECFQEELSILKSDAIRKRQVRAKKDRERKAAQIDRIKVDSIDVRAKLVNYASQPTKRMKNINSYVDVWVACEIAKVRGTTPAIEYKILTFFYSALKIVITYYYW